jgi:pyrimidine deaminase RibD-like protein
MPGRLTPTAIDEAIQTAILEASRSVPEDVGPRPKVGAVAVSLVDERRVSAHRGELEGAHAEFSLIKKLRELSWDPREFALFTTLEPCVVRGASKTPCAERVLEAGFPQVFIGTLDPNPLITGRGELTLLYNGLQVERFSGEASRRLVSINEDFFRDFGAAYNLGEDRATALPDRSWVAGARKSSDRNRLLQATLDMVLTSQADIRILAGDLSWIRQAFVHLLRARLEGRRLTIVCFTGDARDKAKSAEALDALGALGADVSEAAGPPPLRGTALWRSTDEEPGHALVIDAGSAHLLSPQDDPGMLSLLHSLFSMTQEGARPLERLANEPALIQVSNEELVSSLRRSVTQYESAHIEVERIDAVSTLPLTASLEWFKVSRLRLLEAIRAEWEISGAFRVEGSPWIAGPPVLERQADGRLIVVDGTHRLYELQRKVPSEVEAIVVSRVSAPLPASPLKSWDEVRLSLTYLPRERRYANYRADQFRAISTAFRTI